MKRVTLKDIAQRLNVTVGTVSHALNDKDDISEETKELVRKTAREMGYVSNNMAVSLRSGRTQTIAVILSDIANPHLAYQVKQIEQEARRGGYATIIFNTDENPEKEREAIVTAFRQRVDGVLLCPALDNRENPRYLAKLGIPYVLIGRHIPGLEANAVHCDDRKSGYLIASWLLDHGCRRILCFLPKELTGAKERLDGVRTACDERGVALDPSLLRDIPPTSGHGRSCVEAAYREGLEFDSVLCFSDLLGFEVKYALEEVYGARGREIPVAGFDLVQTYLPIPLPFVSVGMEEAGWSREAIALLTKLMDHPHASLKPRDVTLDVHLMSFGAGAEAPEREK